MAAGVPMFLTIPSPKRAFRSRAGLYLVAAMAGLCGCGDASTTSERTGSAEKARSAPVSEDSDTVRYVKAAPVVDYSERSRDGWRVGDTARLLERYGGRNTFGRIHSLHVLGDALVIADQLTEPHLVIVNRATGELVHRFGPDGSGPGEFRDVSTLFTVERRPPVVGAYDVPNGRLTYVRLSGQGFEPELLKDLPFRAAQFVTAVEPMGDRYVATGGFGADYRLVVYDSAGEALRYIQTSNPAVLSERVRTARLDRSLLQNVMAREPDGSRIALAFLHLNRLEIVDLDARSVRVVKGPHPTEVVFTTETRRPLTFDRDRHEKAYFGVATTRDRIYLTFCGCVQTIAEARKGESPMPRRVQVLDWSGHFVGEFSVDREIGGQIAVPPGDSILYASYRTPIPTVGKWRIPEWVRQ